MAARSVSFEFFPPRTPAALDALVETARTLERLGPSFMTVTFGAGGSTRDGTIATLERLGTAVSVPLGCHLTFVSLTRSDLRAYLDRLWGMGVRHIVALRGDLPAGLQWPLDPDRDYYQYTSDFIEGIKAHLPFEISVGAYPEKHPDAPDLAADIVALTKKCAAGADRAITQFFFAHDRYDAFLRTVRAAGIATPVVPGLLPIGNYENMLKFANRCGASVPDAIRAQFASTDEADHPGIAAALLRWQVDDLTARGSAHLHFYTLNRADMLVDALR